MPEHPRAWLVATARNRAIDRIRRERVLEAKTRQLEIPAMSDEPEDTATIADERLELLFTCCHPALSTEAQVGLTLRANWDVSTRRVFIREIVPLYRLRGTKEGLRRMLSFYTGQPVEIDDDHTVPHFFTVALTWSTGAHCAALAK